MPFRLEQLEPRDTPATFVDLSYGDGGYGRLAGLVSVADVVTLGDGSVLVAGRVGQAAGAGDFGVVKLTPAGVPDARFGANGLAVVAFDLAGPGQGDDVPAYLAVLPSGSVVVVGTAATTTRDFPYGPSRVAVARLNSAGVLDATFDGDGRAVVTLTPDGTATDVPLALGVRPDGATVIAAGVTPAAGGFPSGYAARLTPAGAVDAGYGTGGVAALGATVGAAAVDAAGRVFTARRDPTPADAPPRQFVGVVTRTDAAGQADAGYGTAGRAVVGTFGGDDFRFGVTLGVAVLGDGSALFGYDTVQGSIQSKGSQVFRLTPAGTVDAAFGTGGKSTAVFAGTVREGAGGRLVGVEAGNVFGGRSRYVVGLTAAGQPDAGFGDNGVLDPAPLVFTPLRIALSAGESNVYAIGPAAGGVSVVKFIVAGNQPPTVTLDQSAVVIPAGTSRTVFFTARDGALGNPFTVTVVADDPTLVPADGISLTPVGAGGGQSLTLTPAAGRAGRTTVRVTARDAGGLTATADLDVTVQALPAVLGGTTRFAAGPGAGGVPVAGVYGPDGTAVRTTSVFSAGFAGGVRVATADFTGDGVPDLVVGTGPGSASRVEVYDGGTFQRLFATDPFEVAFTGGVFVAAGDLTGDGVPDLVVTPDVGGGPRVRVFSGSGFGLVADFFGIADPAFRGGARAAVGDLNGDGIGDLLVAAGAGGGPRVAGYNGRTVTGDGSGAVKLFGDFFAFEPTLRNGVYLASGDVDGDGFADVIAGAGPGGGPRVTSFSGVALRVVADFFAGDSAARGGVRVAAKDLDGDSRADVVTGAGDGSRVAGYLGRVVTAGGSPTAAFASDPFPATAGGVFVG